VEACAQAPIAAWFLIKKKTARFLYIGDFSYDEPFF